MDVLYRLLADFIVGDLFRYRGRLQGFENGWHGASDVVVIMATRVDRDITLRHGQGQGQKGLAQSPQRPHGLRSTGRIGSAANVSVLFESGKVAAVEYAADRTEIGAGFGGFLGLELGLHFLVDLAVTCSQ